MVQIRTHYVLSTVGVGFMPTLAEDSRPASFFLDQAPAVENEETEFFVKLGF